MPRAIAAFLLTVACLLSSINARADGAAVLIADPTFEVGAGFPDRARAIVTKYGPSKGSAVDEATFDRADRALAEALRGAGWPEATVKHATHEGALDVTIVLGPEVHYVFDGATVFDREALVSFLDLGREPDRSPSHLADKLADAYRRRGYVDARVVPVLGGNADDAIRTLRLRITEGAPVRVIGQAFPCLGDPSPIDRDRLDREIDSFVEEAARKDDGFGEIDPTTIDATLGSASYAGARPTPTILSADELFLDDAYARAAEHLAELFRDEGFYFVQVGDPTLVRAPEGAPSVAIDSSICRLDPSGVPLPPAPIVRTCVADPPKGVVCADEGVVAIPIELGPRAIAWDLAFDGTAIAAPNELGAIAKTSIRLGEPLSPKEVEAARRAILGWYRDRAYAFAKVDATLEWSSDRTRARVRFAIVEGEPVSIASIRVEGNVHTSASIVRDLLLLHEGGLFRADLARASEERLRSLGTFSSVSIALDEPDVVASRKTVVVRVVDRIAGASVGPGYATSEGARLSGDVEFPSLFGAAIDAHASFRVSYQPFAFCCGIYDPDVVRRWRALSHVERIAGLVDVGLLAPYNPLTGADVRTSLDLVYSHALLRDFFVDKSASILGFGFRPTRAISASIGGSLEHNALELFDRTTLGALLADPRTFGTYGSLLRVPEGSSTIVAARASFLFDLRDTPLYPTKNGFFSLIAELVTNVDRPPRQDDGTRPRQEFLHLDAKSGAYVPIRILPAHPIVLSLLLGAGANFDVFRCAHTPSGACDAYPDRQFYLGGVDSNRGYYLGQQMPQDVIDAVVAREPDPAKRAQLLAAIARGGNVYLNPRAQLSVRNFFTGDVHFFFDASNAWRDLVDVDPTKLRYATGMGFTLDTGIVPVAADFGVLLRPRESVPGEPAYTLQISLGAS